MYMDLLWGSNTSEVCGVECLYGESVGYIPRLTISSIHMHGHMKGIIIVCPLKKQEQTPLSEMYWSRTIKWLKMDIKLKVPQYCTALSFFPNHCLWFNACLFYFFTVGCITVTWSIRRRTSAKPSCQQGRQRRTAGMLMPCWSHTRRRTPGWSRRTMSFTKASLSWRRRRNGSPEVRDGTVANGPVTIVT